MTQLNELLLSDKVYLFRGQGNSNWKLESGLYRNTFLTLQETCQGKDISVEMLIMEARQSGLLLPYNDLVCLKKTLQNRNGFDVKNIVSIILQYSENYTLYEFIQKTKHSGLPLPLDTAELEKHLKYKLYDKSGGEKSPPSGCISDGVLSIMQHHGFKTSLLDWSYSSDVALYFMLEQYLSLEEQARGDIMSLYILDKTDIIEKKAQYPGHSDDSYHYYGSFSIIEPYHQHDRGLNQHSVFTRLDSYQYEDDKYSPYFTKFDIPATLTADLYRYLDKKRINAAHVYPGYEGIGKYITERNIIQALQSQ